MAGWLWVVQHVDRVPLVWEVNRRVDLVRDDVKGYGVQSRCGLSRCKDRASLTFAIPVLSLQGKFLAASGANPWTGNRLDMHEIFNQMPLAAGSGNVPLLTTIAAGFETS